MKIRRIAATLLACTLLTAAGCGNKQEESSGTASTPATTAGTQQTASETEPAEPATEAVSAVHNHLTGETG